MTPMIDMKGLDFAKGPEGGIYLMAGDTSPGQVARGAGRRLPMGRGTKLKGWDGGRFVPGDVKTSADAIAATGLGWTVEKHPIIKLDPVLGVTDGGPGVIGWEPRTSDTAPAVGKYQQPNKLPTGGYDIVRDHCMNVRQDTGAVLGIVGPGWVGPQNHEAFSFVDDLVDNGDAKWLGGGELQGGRRIWMVAQLAAGTLLGGDENEMSIPLCFLSNGWDGYTSLQVNVAPYRMACLNGQTIPLEGHVRTWKVRHTTNHASKLLVARQTLELSIGYFDAWTVEMEKLMKAKVSDATVTKTLKVLFPDAAKGKGDEDRKTAQNNVEKKRDAVLTIFRDEPDLQNLARSKYRLFNAVTAYADWHVKGPAEKQVLRSAEPSKIKDQAFAMLAGSAS